MKTAMTDTTLAEFVRQEWDILLTIMPRLTMCVAFQKELKARGVAVEVLTMKPGDTVT